jgi:hypothetical protein
MRLKRANRFQIIAFDEYHASNRLLSTGRLANRLNCGKHPSGSGVNWMPIKGTSMLLEWSMNTRIMKQAVNFV